MLKIYTYKIVYSGLFLLYIFNKRILNNNEKINQWILKKNNKIVERRVKRESNEKILILLPHCVQNENCKIRVTNNLENCIVCGKCNLGEIRKLEKYKEIVIIKIATGGTIARQHIKEIKPCFIIAVACERDLMTGIFDASPFPVYGIFNEIKKKQCQGTDFNVEEINKVLNKLVLRGVK